MTAHEVDDEIRAFRWVADKVSESVTRCTALWFAAAAVQPARPALSMPCSGWAGLGWAGLGWAGLCACQNEVITT